MRKSEMIKAVQETLVAEKAKKSLIEAINAIMAEYNRTAKAKEEHPNVLDDNGTVTQVWCHKHNQYEDVRLFNTVARNKTGYDTYCKIANKQRAAFNKQIAEVETQLSEALNADDFVKAKELNQTKKELNIKKGGAYPVPTDEEIETILNPETK